MSGDIIRVFDAAKRGCNTTRDIADVTGMSIEISAAWVSKLLSYGALVRTGRRVKQPGRGRPAQCFEVAPAFTEPPA